MGCKHTPLPEVNRQNESPMPRLTYSTPKPSALSIQEELRCLHLAVKLRSEQVKLRRLEWDTVSYTHLRAHRDATLSRMPSSA